MVYYHFRKTQGTNLCGGFTLIELLIVIAVIALFLGILLPVLHKVRVVSKRVVCQSNLRQIAIAWQLYLDNNDESFYQGVNTNHDFGGWKGNGGFARYRPLNSYLNLPLEVDTEEGATVFRCPADRGGILGCPPLQLAYHYFGNSYQTNILMIGPNKIFVPDGPLRPLHQEINKCIKQLKRTSVDNHSRLLLVGDNGWVNQWLPLVPHRISWHNKSHYHNMAFLDSHVEFVNIRKGLYVTEEYSVLPLKELYGLAQEVQEEKF